MAYKRKSLKEVACEYRVIVRFLATVLKSPDAACDFIDEFEYQLGLWAWCAICSNCMGCRA